MKLFTKVKVASHVIFTIALASKLGIDGAELTIAGQMTYVVLTALMFRSNAKALWLKLFPRKLNTVYVKSLDKLSAPKQQEYVLIE